MPKVHIRFITHSSGTIHATMFNSGERQTIAILRGFFCAVTHVSRDAVLGAIEVEPFIAAALGFIVPTAKGEEIA